MSPTKSLIITRKLGYGLGIVCILGHVGAALWIFWGTPLEAIMGYSQKIMFVHLSVVLIAYVAFFIVFTCSILYLWRRSTTVDNIARASAELGVIFCGLTLLTGSLWGKPTWGAYWVWDARLTTTLLLFLIYVGYVLLRRFSNHSSTAARNAAVLGIIGFLDVPLVHFSVVWWRTLHQPSTLFNVTNNGLPRISMPLEYVWPLLLCLVLVGLTFWLLLRLRLKTLRLEQELYSIINR